MVESLTHLGRRRRRRVLEKEVARQRCNLIRADRKSQVRQYLVFVQLNLVLIWPMIKLNKNPNIA